MGVAEQPDIHARRGEARVLTCHGEIATRHELAPSRRGDAVHRRDDRLSQRDDGRHHLGAGVHDLGEIGAPAIGVAAMRGHLLEIVTRAEKAEPAPVMTIARTPSEPAISPMAACRAAIISSDRQLRVSGRLGKHGHLDLDPHATAQARRGPAAARGYWREPASWCLILRPMRTRLKLLPKIPSKCNLCLRQEPERVALGMVS